MLIDESPGVLQSAIRNLKSAIVAPVRLQQAVLTCTCGSARLEVELDGELQLSRRGERGRPRRGRREGARRAEGRQRRWQCESGERGDGGVVDGREVEEGVVERREVRVVDDVERYGAKTQ